MSQRLVSPSTAEFPFVSDYDKVVNRLGDDRVVVVGFVDSQNRFGATLRADFSCRMQFLGGDDWLVEKLDIFPR